jgi:hypothetical protein
MTSHVAVTWCDTCAGMLTTEGEMEAGTTETTVWKYCLNVCHLALQIRARTSYLTLRGGGGSRPGRHTGRGGRGAGRGADHGDESRGSPGPTQSTTTSNQIVKFLIDGASSDTIVNDIDLLMPGTVVHSTSQYKTARTGSEMKTTAHGLLSRMWQQRNQSWVAFEPIRAFGR